MVKIGDHEREDESVDELNLNRRSILSKVAVGAGTVVGMSGTAMGNTEKSLDQQKYQRMIKRFESNAAIKEAFETHAGDLMKTLSEKSIISSSSKSRLMDTEKAKSTLVGVIEEDGQPTTHLQMSFDLESGTITEVVHAESGKSYAFYRPEGVDKNQPQIIDPEQDMTTEQNENVSIQRLPCSVRTKDCRYASCDGWDDIFVSGSEFNKVCCENSGCHWENLGNCCPNPEY